MDETASHGIRTFGVRRKHFLRFREDEQILVLRTDAYERAHLLSRSRRSIWRGAVKGRTASDRGSHHVRFTHEDAAYTPHPRRTPSREAEMEKLRLDPESLRVQSFAPSAERRPSEARPGATRPHVCDPVTAWC